MPRTKRVSKNNKKQATDCINNEKETRKQEIESYIKEFDFNCKYLLEGVDAECETVLNELKVMTKRCKDLIPPRIGNTPIEDLSRVLGDSTHFITISDTTSHSNILELTNAVRSVKANRTKRSVSAADDEGYHTSENCENSGGTQRSRTRSKQSKVVRPSRSLSRSKEPKSQLPFNSFKTPQNKAPKTDYGFVTPKVKPNTPQVILRRPKEGEMAISMQGSPLMVNTIVSREANVNIPLEDGRTISIQPQHGLRMSQLPAIDSSIRRQIEVLRDNLIKTIHLDMLSAHKVAYRVIVLAAFVVWTTTRKHMPNGHIYRGKNRLYKEVTMEDLQDLKNQFRIEEQNMFYLRHPYLTQEQSHGHAKALQKSEKRMENLIKTKKPFKEHVTLESRLGHLRYSEAWE
ncbi:putative cell division cycle-associated protein 8 [Trypoxylus dichotomus]